MQIKDDGTFHIVYRQFFVPETYSHLLTASPRRIIQLRLIRAELFEVS